MASAWSRKSNPAARQLEPQLSPTLERYDFGLNPVLLGRGASATVYKVTDKHLRRSVALKVFKAENAFTDNELNSLASLAGLGGPNLISFTDHGRISVPGDTRLLPFIAMEYWQGTTLRDDAPSHVSWADGAPEDARRWCEDTIEVIRQCFSGIHQLHQGQVKHLDIKPSNIFITREPNGAVMAAKILDLGLSSIGRVADQRGTPLYMAPEQAAGREVTESADVFSMGIVAYELLTRHHPFADRPRTIDIDALLRNVTSVIPTSIKELNPHVPDSVALVVHKALAKDPRDRPSSGEVVRLLKSVSVFTKEWHSIAGRVSDARDQYERGDLEGASETLWDLERKGWAFPEIVALRTRVSAAKCDQEITTRIGYANEHFQRNDLTSARIEVIAAQEQRRFDPRVLQAEAEHQLRLDQLDRQEEDIAAIEEALQGGYSRQAWWRLEILRIRQECDPFRQDKHRVEYESLRLRLDTLLTNETSWLARMMELIRAGRFDEADAECARVGSSVLATSAVRAQELEVRAQRQRPVLQNTLAALDALTRASRASLTENAAASADSSHAEAIGECLKHLRMRNDLIANLVERAARCEEAADTVGQLDLIETLLRIAPDEELQHQERELHELLSAELSDQRMAFALAGIRRVSEMGAWERARELANAVSPEFRTQRELTELERRTNAQMKRAETRANESETIVGHLRRAEPQEALQALRKAQQADPDSMILAVALAACLHEESARLKRSGDLIAALHCDDEYQALLRARDSSPLLKQARDFLINGPAAKPELPVADSTSGPRSGSLTPQPSFEPAPVAVALEPEPVAAALEPALETVTARAPEPTRTGFMRRLISRSASSQPQKPEPTVVQVEPQSAEAEAVIEWERGPDGRPRRKQ